MGRLLFAVEAVFPIRQWGVVAFPGVVPRQGEVFRVGDALELRRPDGATVKTFIAGLELVHVPVSRGGVPVLLPQDDVPIGTEVWSA